MVNKNFTRIAGEENPFYDKNSKNQFNKLRQESKANSNFGQKVKMINFTRKDAEENRLWRQKFKKLAF